MEAWRDHAELCIQKCFCAFLSAVSSRDGFQDGNEKILLGYSLIIQCIVYPPMELIHCDKTEREGCFFYGRLLSLQCPGVTYNHL